MAGTPVPGIPKAPITPTLIALLTQKRYSLSLHCPCLGYLLLSSRGDHSPGHHKHQFLIKNHVSLEISNTAEAHLSVAHSTRSEGGCLLAPAASEMQLSWSVQVSGTEQGCGFY